MKLKYMMAALAVACTMASCDDKLENFEVQGYLGAPASIGSITSTPLPGQIQLNWEVPEDADFTYMKIWYNDPLQKKTVYKIASRNSSEMLIDDTRARFGEYEFFYQTFNAKDEGSEVGSFKALSGAAPATVTLKDKVEIAINPDKLSGEIDYEYYGSIENLVDGDNSTGYYPYIYSGSDNWIQMELNEEHQNFIIEIVNSDSPGYYPTPPGASLKVSMEGKNWVDVATLSGIPSAGRYTSDYFSLESPFKFLRYHIKYPGGGYWGIREIKLYDAILEIYDPETVALD